VKRGQVFNFYTAGNNFSSVLKIFCVQNLVKATCDIVPLLKDTSFWLILELARIVNFCCVLG
jgi:hypothetical protein